MLDKLDRMPHSAESPRDSLGHGSFRIALIVALALNRPRSACSDPSGGLIVVDSGERRIEGIDSEGRLSFLVQGEKRKNGFYIARPLGFDSLGRFYLDDTVMDIATTSTARRQIVRFSPSGRYLGVVADFDFKGEAMSDWESHPIFG
jgi:hypothetical protein